MSKTRFRIFAVLSILIIPTVGFCLSDKPRRVPPPTAAKAVVAPLDDDAKLEWAMRRSIANQGGYVGVTPASSQPNCANIVTNVYGWEGDGPRGGIILYDTFDWDCQTATSQVACQTVTVMTVFNAGGEWRVWHQDNGGLACSGETVVTNTFPTGGAAGEFSVNVDIYPGTWATWTPSTPVIGSAGFSFEVP